MNPQNSDTVVALKTTIADYLSGYDIVEPYVAFDRPTDFAHGDITSNVALRHAKTAGKSPLELAEEIRTHVIEQEIEHIANISVAEPGFINISFAPAFFKDVVTDINVTRENFGKNDAYAGETWVIEHTSPNPNKAMHIGHLRNNLVGMGLVRLLSWSGATTVSEAVDNNRGIAIAKLMWGFLAHMRKDDTTPIDTAHWLEHQDQWFTPEEKGMAPDEFVTACYVFAEARFQEDTEVEQNIREFAVAWEDNDETIRKLWTHVLRYAHEGIERTLARIGNRWDNVWHEHEYYHEGKDYVTRGVKEGIFQKLDNGAVLTDLGEYDLPDTILLKQDGTSLYITQDIALTARKKERHKADKLVWVIGPEQTLAMQQLFAVCEQIGIGTRDEFTHVSYGYVGLKDGDGGFKKMSSRAGSVVLIDDIIDGVKKRITERILEDGNNDTTADARAEQLALAAVKFAMLRIDRTQNMVFDPEQSITTTGDSGIYVMYAYVRAQSILGKSASSEERSVRELDSVGDERSVLQALMYFPNVVESAREDLSLHHVAQHALELSSAFNSWYNKETILDNTDREPYKLALTEAVSVVLSNALAILGIETIDRM